MNFDNVIDAVSQKNAFCGTRKYPHTVIRVNATPYKEYKEKCGFNGVIVLPNQYEHNHTLYEFITEKKKFSDVFILKCGKEKNTPFTTVRIKEFAFKPNDHDHICIDIETIDDRVEDNHIDNTVALSAIDTAEKTWSKLGHYIDDIKDALKNRHDIYAYGCNICLTDAEIEWSRMGHSIRAMKKELSQPQGAKAV